MLARFTVHPLVNDECGGDRSFLGCLSVTSGSSGSPGCTETEVVVCQISFQKHSLLP